MKKLYRFLSPKFQTLFSEYPVKMVPRYGHGKPPHGELYSIIDKNREEYREILTQALTLKDWIQEINKLDQESDLSSPGWNNGMLPGLDIVGIYAMIALKKPTRYIEVGSGNSTKVAFKAKSDHNLSTEIISIDPMPRAEIDNLADKIIREPFENIDYSEILSLEAGEMLFIDNSHRILPNSDAMVFFMEILPKLKKGVIVHIHDIYLPYDYPQFMCDRFYTEQYGLAMFILANPEKYATILPNYFISEDKELSELIAPMWDHPNLKGVEQHGGSFWLEIR
ncbi:MAG: class I SAM-dependent methyltransferase [Crocinitomicaceae bacterium]|nr:class I SAM-dependent methyltransferase [Flavobacteriales bacterium]NQZ35573.1 class I SAM-dependent methyltransferase [Crocinitomicaceae bacterium]